MKMRRPPRRSRVKSVVSFVVCLVVIIVLMMGFPPDYGGPYLAIAAIYVILFATIFVHETGHAVVGLATGGSITLFCVRPIGVVTRPFRIVFIGRRRFRDRIGGGGVAFRFRGNSRRGKYWAGVLLAGPAANIIVGLVTLLALYPWKRDDWLAALLAGFASISIWIGIANLIPIDRCDGWKLMAIYRSRGLRRRISGLRIVLPDGPLSNPAFANCGTRGSLSPAFVSPRCDA